MSQTFVRARRARGTLNFSESAPPFIFREADFLLCDEMTFMAGQEEVGAEGTHHIQFYCEFSKAMTLRAILDLDMFLGLHEEGYSLTFLPANASREANLAYVHKDDETTVADTRFTWGEGRQQGKRNDLLELKRAVDDGASAVTLWDNHFSTMLRYSKGVLDYKRLKQRARSEKTIVFLFVGPTGTGKSRTMHELALYLAAQCGESEYYSFPLKHTGFWCDDYDGHSVCILDEMDGNRMVPTQFNLLCDRYPTVLPAHGSAGRQFSAKYLLVGSNYLPKYWWSRKHGHQLDPILRRIDATIPMLIPRDSFLRSRGRAPEPRPVAVVHGEQGRFLFDAHYPASLSPQLVEYGTAPTQLSIHEPGFESPSSGIPADIFE